VTGRTADERRGSYRRRLLAAAAASLLLHFLLTRGLAVTTLRLDAERAAEAEKTKPRQERPRADFPLQVRKTPPSPPAHERPLDLPLPVPPPQPQRSPPVPERTREVAERRPEETVPAPQPTPAAPAARPSRPLDTALTPTPTQSPARESMPAAAAPQARVEPIAAAAAPSDSQAVAPAPAAMPAPQAAAAPAPQIASRWRPREVALLERLTAPVAPATTAPRSTDPADLAAGPAAPSPGRQATIAAGADAATTIDPVAAPAVATSSPSSSSALATAAQPRERDAPRGTAAATAARAGSEGEAPRLVAIPRADAALAASSGAAARVAKGDAGMPVAQPASVGRRSTADASAGGVAGAVAAVAAPRVVGSGSPPGPAPAPQGSGRPQSSAAPALSGGASAATGAIADGPASLPVGPRPVAPTVGAVGAARTGDTAAGGLPSLAQANPEPISRASSVASAAAGGDRADAIAAPVAAPVVGPSAIVGAATPLPLPGRSDRPATGSALARPDIAPAEADDEELSVPVSAPVSAPHVATVAPAPRRDATEPPATTQAGPLERLATATVLPTDGRVRDVAEAFARRAKSRPPSAAGSAGETADRLVDRGLEFLARSQQPDGRWSLGRFAGAGAGDAPRLQSDTAATGLALLSFLGAGHDHYGGPHRDTVRRGLEYLLSIQKENGDLYVPADDLSNSCAWLYSHGIAAIAVCEAVGMTGDPRLRPAAEKACRFITASQHRERGGWRYTPGTDADLSVSGWMLVALRSGDLAGVKTEPATLAGIRRLVEASASPADPARYAYNPRSPQQRPSALSISCMTAVGALMRLHTGDTPRAPGVKEPCRVLATLLPSYGSSSNRTRDAYLWYYASQVLVHDEGADWDRWYAALVETLAAQQEAAGAKRGSWDPLGPVPDRWGVYGGRIYVTALHLLALEVPYRHLPTYGR
jgi:hypothetical protein